MSEDLMPSPEHFELLRGALDHIAKTARASRSQTRRLRWIELRAETALRGEVYRDQDIDRPKNAGPNTPERLRQRLVQTKAEKHELLEALRVLVDADAAQALDNRMFERARAAIARAAATKESSHD